MVSEVNIAAYTRLDPNDRSAKAGEEQEQKRKAAKKRLRSLRCKAAANRRTSAPDYDGVTATQHMRDAYWAKMMLAVDPEEKLPYEQRLAKAKRLWRSRMDAAKADALARKRSPRRCTAA